MGIRHVVMFRWADGVTEDQVAELEKHLAAVPGKIPVLRSYKYGADLRLNEGNFDYAIVADLDSTEDFVAYRDHPDHVALVKDVIKPLVADRAAAQFALDG